MAFGLPDSVSQGLGFAPPTPADDGYGGLHPAVLQGLGLQQPFPVEPDAPLPPPVAPDVPLQLPSAAAMPPPVPVEAQPDFRVPIKAIDGPGTPPVPVRPAPPQRPPTVDQQFAAADAAQNRADQASQQANTASTQVKVAEADDQLKNYQAADAQHAQIQSELKAEQDEYKKTYDQKAGILDGFRKQQDSYKVDQGKYWNELGVGDHVGWYVAMALSGLGNAFLGMNNPSQGAAKNPVIEMLQQKIHENIVGQENGRDELNKRAGRAEQDLDKFDAFSKDKQARIMARSAEADRAVASMIRTTSAKYAAPTALANGATLSAELDQGAAKKDAEAAKIAGDRDMAKKQLGATYAGLSQSDRHFKSSQDESRRQFDITSGLAQERLDKENIRLAKTDQEAKDKIVRERSLGGEVTPVKDANGKITGYKTGEITMKDGTTFVPKGTDPTVTALQKQHNAISAVIGTMDRIVQLGPEWLSDTANSAKKQQLDELITTAKLQAIAAFDLGVPSGKDEANALGALGTDNPTKLRESLPGIMEGRKTMVRTHNVNLATAGLDKTWEPPDLSKAPKAEPTIVDKIATTLKAEPDQNPERARKTVFNATYKANGGDLAAAHVAAEQAAENARSGKISPDQVQGIADLKALALAGGDHGASAIEALKDIIQTKDSEAVKRTKGASDIFGRPLAVSTSDSPIRALAEQTLREIQAGPPQPIPVTPQAGPAYDPNAYDPESLIKRFHAPVQQTLPTGPVATK